MFAIDRNNGIIRLIKPVREKDGVGVLGESYSVVIAATDHGTSSRTGTAQLQVHISDVNDPPIFPNHKYVYKYSHCM